LTVPITDFRAAPGAMLPEYAADVTGVDGLSGFDTCSSALYS